MAILAVFAGLLLTLGTTWGADIVDPNDCTEFPCLIFEDNFDFLDSDVWEHEVNMVGGGNQEFQIYVNNRSISYTQDGLLFIKPDLTSHWKGEEFLSNGDLDLWGMNGVNDVCTGNLLGGCRRQATSADIIPPVHSARLRTSLDFNYLYGRLEFRAKLPKGDWLWPAIWLMPYRFPYGGWPASGEIDVMESRGNEDFGDMNNRLVTCALHAGPYPGTDQPDFYGSYNPAADSSLVDDFNTWVFDWTDEYMSVSVNGEEIMYADPITNMYDHGNFAAVNADNPWAGADKLAPFDQPFYLILNVAVGGIGYFPDGIPSNTTKPWTNDSPTPELDFWEGRDQWYPTWTQGGDSVSDGAALQIDYIRVYKMASAKM